MNVLQIANGYLEKKLYKNLFKGIEEQADIYNLIFVPIKFGYNQKNKLDGNVIVVQCFYDLDRLFFFPKQRKIFRALKCNYDFDGIDLIHAHTLFSNGYSAYKLNRKYGVPYMVTVRNTDINIFLKKFIYLRKIGIEILANACSIVFLSNSYKYQLLEKYVPSKLKKDIEIKCHIIPNGIDDFFFKKKSSIPKKLGDVITIIHMGDIDKNKNIGVTIEAIKILYTEGYKLRFRIVGEIKEERLQQLIDKEEFIDYYPKCNQKEVISHYAEADMLCVPSHYETFGLVYAEAMSQGLPVVYTRGQGFDGQFKDGVVGFSVDDTNPNELADVIKKVIERYYEISDNCVRMAEKFRWSKVAKAHIDIYKCIGREKNNG